MTDLIALDNSARHPDHQILDRNDWRQAGAAIDFLIMPTVGFGLLFVLVILSTSAGG